MDIGMHRDEEHFSSFDTNYYLSPDNLDSLEGPLTNVNKLFECLDDMVPERNCDSFDWDNEHERGDTSNVDVMSSSTLEHESNLSVSPPIIKEEYQRMLNWRTTFHVSATPSDINMVESIIPYEEDEKIINEKNSSLQELLDLPELNCSKFDIASYVCGDHNDQLNTSISSINSDDCDIKPTIENIKLECSDVGIIERKPRIGVKKIDLEAQRYIVDENLRKSMTEDEEVDIETVSEEEIERCPMLEAPDLKSLLEQFEAVENPEQMETSCIESIDNRKNIKVEPPDDIFVEECTNNTNIKVEINTDTQKISKNKSPDNTTIRNKQILDSLPRELINRIKESGKRKPITVIPPIPNSKKRLRQEKKSDHKTADHRTVEPRIQPEVKQIKVVNQENKVQKAVVSDMVHLDHNYCSNSSPGRCSKKDSGFESSEDDDRAVINKQPTVKNADGTLMVSLLKVNTIRTHTLPQKKKLNLEEYKKRRKVFTSSNNTSQSCSPSTSSCGSPLPEDENLKLIRHQEKLRKMALEVLSAAPKSDKKPGNLEVKKSPKSVVQNSTPKPVPQPDLGVCPPPHLERKILVSFGVNTDFQIAKDEDPLAPVEKLETIKPLLQKVSDKINECSLITSVIETIPKIISKSEKPSKVSSSNEEHGENKQVLHLQKDRIRNETKSVATQTNISLIDQSKRGRRRRKSSSSSASSSSSSGSERNYARSRKSSESSSVSSRSSSSSRERSRCSYSSRLSNYSRSRTRSRSRSRSRSPLYRRKRSDKEHLNAVEERRIIYVGRISRSTTRESLRKKFFKFGPIVNISLHFRDNGEHYGFVTFKYKQDAHEAYEHGNDDPAHPYYKISFGGRREFCKTSYADLDNMRDDVNFYHPPPKMADDSFDSLLREVQEKMRKRKV